MKYARSKIRQAASRLPIGVHLSVVAVLITAATIAAPLQPARAQTNGLWLVSRTPQGPSAAGASASASISADGRFVAFESEAADLVPDDTNGVSDVFLFDRMTGAVTRVGLTAAGGQPDKRSVMPALSADAAWLVFRSDQALTADAAPFGGLYLRELATGATSLIAAADDGGRGENSFPAISADGGRILFESRAALDGAAAAEPTPRKSAVFVWTRATGALMRVSPADLNADALDVAISGDGTQLAFCTDATNLADAKGQLAGAVMQVYVKNSAQGTIERVSRAVDGSAGNDASREPTLSGDGRIVAFSSIATNLVMKDVNLVSDIFVLDRQKGTIIPATDVVPADSVYHPGHSSDPSLSADGLRLAFASAMYTLVADDRNRALDVYVRNLATGQTRRVSLTASGAESDSGSWAPAFAAEGNFVAFTAAGAMVAADRGAFDDIYLRGVDSAQPHPAATNPPHPSGTATSAGHGTPTPAHATATSQHGTRTPTHGTAVPTSAHGSATPAHTTPTSAHGTSTPGHGTATPAATHPPHDTATPPHGSHPTATPVHHGTVTATPDMHHTATPVHPTHEPTHGAPGSLDPAAVHQLLFPLIYNDLP